MEIGEALQLNQLHLVLDGTVNDTTDVVEAVDDSSTAHKNRVPVFSGKELKAKKSELQAAFELKDHYDRIAHEAAVSGKKPNPKRKAVPQAPAHETKRQVLAREKKAENEAAKKNEAVVAKSASTGVVPRQHPRRTRLSRFIEALQEGVRQNSNHEARVILENALAAAVEMGRNSTDPQGMTLQQRTSIENRFKIFPVSASRPYYDAVVAKNDASRVHANKLANRRTNIHMFRRMAVLLRIARERGLDMKNVIECKNAIEPPSFRPARIEHGDVVFYDPIDALTSKNNDRNLFVQYISKILSTSSMHSMQLRMIAGLFQELYSYKLQLTRPLARLHKLRVTEKRLKKARSSKAMLRFNDGQLGGAHGEITNEDDLAQPAARAAVVRVVCEDHQTMAIRHSRVFDEIFNEQFTLLYDLNGEGCFHGKLIQYLNDGCKDREFPKKLTQAIRRGLKGHDDVIDPILSAQLDKILNYITKQEVSTELMESGKPLHPGPVECLREPPLPCLVAFERACSADVFDTMCRLGDMEIFTNYLNFGNGIEDIDCDPMSNYLDSNGLASYCLMAAVLAVQNSPTRSIYDQSCIDRFQGIALDRELMYLYHHQTQRFGRGSLLTCGDVEEDPGPSCYYQDDDEMRILWKINSDDIKIFAIVTLAVALCLHIVGGRGVDLLTCGDVEANPGPPKGENQNHNKNANKQLAVAVGCNKMLHEQIEQMKTAQESLEKKLAKFEKARDDVGVVRHYPLKKDLLEASDIENHMAWATWPTDDLDVMTRSQISEAECRRILALPYQPEPTRPYMPYVFALMWAFLVIFLTHKYRSKFFASVTGFTSETVLGWCVWEMDFLLTNVVTSTMMAQLLILYFLYLAYMVSNWQKRRLWHPSLLVTKEHEVLYQGAVWSCEVKETALPPRNLEGPDDQTSCDEEDEEDPSAYMSDKGHVNDVRPYTQVELPLSAMPKYAVLKVWKRVIGYGYGGYTGHDYLVADCRCEAHGALANLYHPATNDPESLRTAILHTMNRIRLDASVNSTLEDQVLRVQAAWYVRALICTIASTNKGAEGVLPKSF